MVSTCSGGQAARDAALQKKGLGPSSDSEIRNILWTVPVSECLRTQSARAASCRANGLEYNSAVLQPVFNAVGASPADGREYWGLAYDLASESRYVPAARWHAARFTPGAKVARVLVDAGDSGLGGEIALRSSGTHVKSGELAPYRSHDQTRARRRPTRPPAPPSESRRTRQRPTVLRPLAITAAETGLRPLAITAAEHCAIQKHPSLVPVGGDSDMQHRPSGVEPGSARALSGQSPVHTSREPLPVAIESEDPPGPRSGL